MAELTGMLDLSSWPAGMRVIVRKEAPSRCAVAVHRPRRTATDRIRHQHHHRAIGGPGTTSPSPGPLRRPHPYRQDCGLRNLPLHGFDQNRIWCVIVELACELLAWTQMLALTDSPARRWEPKSTTTTTIFSRSTPNPPCPPTSPQTRHRRTTPAPAPGRDTHSDSTS